MKTFTLAEVDNGWVMTVTEAGYTPRTRAYGRHSTDLIAIFLHINHHQTKIEKANAAIALSRVAARKRKVRK